MVKKKLQESSFLVTINPNISVEPDSESQYELEGRIRDFIDDVFSEPNFMDGDSPPMLTLPDNYEFGDIERVAIDKSIEHGSKRGFLHCHMLVEIKRRCGSLKLNLKYIRERGQQEFGHKIHLDGKALRSGAEQKENVRKYIKKGEKPSLYG